MASDVTTEKQNLLFAVHIRAERRAITAQRRDQLCEHWPFSPLKHKFVGLLWDMVVTYVFLLEEAMYSWCYVCILIVSLCYSCLCVVYVFLDAATLTGVFSCSFLSCKANARVNLAKTRHGPHSPKLLCCSVYCLFCVVLCIVCV